MKELRTIPGYRLISCLYEGQPVCVWRGTRDSDALQVVLKLAKGGQPQLQQVVRLKQEYAIARNLPVNGIVRALDLLEFDGGCVLVLEDVEGTSLDRVIAETPLSTEQALAVAAELAGILGEIHSHLFQRALALREAHTHRIDDLAKFKEFFTPRHPDNPEIHGGFALCHLSEESAAKEVSDELKVTIRCIPLDAGEESGRCIFTGKPSTRRVLFAKAY